MSGPGDDVVMTIDTDGPGGLPGALRTAAACGPVVPISASLALRIAREVEAGAGLAEALRSRAEVDAMAMATLEEARRTLSLRILRLFLCAAGVSLMCGLALGWLLWGAA
jgi:hypothetical protein